MNTDELKTLASTIEAILRDKGYVRASCWFSIASERISAYIDYYLNANDLWEQRKTANVYELKSFDDLRSEIEALPSRLDLARAEFLKRLAHLVEDADKLELKIPELRPLFETYQNNLLEHHA